MTLVVSYVFLCNTPIQTDNFKFWLAYPFSMRFTKDYYAMLGISRNATENNIKTAFRRLALKYHPDRNKGHLQAEERFKDINEAYTVLSDSKIRAQYDLFDPQSFQQSSQRDRTGRTEKDRNRTVHNSDSVDDLFGQGSGQGYRQGFGQGYRRANTMPPDYLEELLRGLDEIIKEQRARYITITPQESRRGFTRRVEIKAQWQRIFINTADTYTEKRNANIKIRKEKNGKQIETLEQFDFYLGLPLDEKVEFEIRLEHCELYGTVVHDGLIYAMNSDVDLRLSGDINVIMHNFANVKVTQKGFIVSHDDTFDNDTYRILGVRATHHLRINATQSDVSLKYRQSAK